MIFFQKESFPKKNFSLITTLFQMEGSGIIWEKLFCNQHPFINQRSTLSSPENTLCFAHVEFIILYRMCHTHIIHTIIHIRIDLYSFDVYLYASLCALVHHFSRRTPPQSAVFQARTWASDHRRNGSSRLVAPVHLDRSFLPQKWNM